ncbi:DUF4139 domain-containing protein [Ottowia sp.]|uniref:DUF4139 domain-containing protein n=1 Tax=Ottowia sp. TaxID=1898956 RepID=UPI002BD09EC5|nr:DUF4139 domain-containing protein [Ottowia sp.]HOB66342.1 DUF4139 domain-containing protein [Ottowia sp.]HPZ58495.1 DUF4139 domain-containing protein [Ottowia sp.]HQD47388.1 DUF4139 domain-containing protein [Ottowia sp.]
MHFSPLAHSLPRCLLPMLALCALAPALAQPAEARADASRVTAVKLYPGSATVERALRVTPGARHAVFACLPAGLDAASLQVSADASVRVGELAVRQLPRGLLGNACASPLDERIRALEDQVAALTAESAGIGYAAGYFKSFENAASGADSRAAPAQIGATAQALRQSARDALTRQHQIKRQQEALERELKPLLAERDRAGAQDASVSTVQVTLAAPQGGELRLTYQVRGPGWQPSYRATLDSATKKVRLERQALVAQATGEDWSGVQLTLSTGQPGAATQGPLPRPWRVGIEPPVQPVAMPAPAMMAAAPAPMTRMRAAAAEAAEPMPSFDVSVFQGSFATEFVLPQKISVPSSGQRVTLSLGEQWLDTRLLVRSAPALDAAAYLIAEVAAPPGVWPSGPVNLYRDGAYVGQGRFDSAQLARSGLAFGRDELVNVRVEQPARTDGTGGFINTRNERRVSRQYTLENRHREAITLQVLDAAPVAEHQDVRVESRYQPEPASKAWNDQPGTVAWQQTLAAGASQRLVAEHVITWPKDERLREQR